MKRMRTTIVMVTICISITAGMLLSGCYYDKEALLYHKTAAIDCTTISSKFSTDVAPIMKNKCATSGCHDAAGNAGGTILETYAQVSAAAARINQRAIIDQTMPPAGPLSPSETAVLTCWISAGTPNN